MEKRKTFLTAEWRKLAMVNYQVDPELLTPYIPAHTELDLWNERCYVTLVGFRFLNTRIKGVKVPFHVNFEEINLRFYVRYKDGKQWKRGVVFLLEIVPKYAVAFIANALFDERYTRMPTASEWDRSEDRLKVAYYWKKGTWNGLYLTADPEPVDMEPGSEEEFIAEHYWGYSDIDAKQSSEYKVEHPSWQLYRVLEHKVDVDFESCFGPAFAFLKDSSPSSVFLAEGSDVTLRDRRVLDRPGI